MVNGVPEAYWENLGSSVPGFLITPLSKVRTALHHGSCEEKTDHELSDPTAALEAISQPTAKLALEASKRPRKRPRKKNPKELQY